MHTRIIPQLAVVLLLCTFTNPFLNAQQSFWSPDYGSKSGISKAAFAPDIPELEKGRLYRLDVNGVRDYLRTAPSELQVTGGSATTISLPLPTGELQTFEVWESSLMAPGLADRYSDIKSYLIRGIDDPTAGGRMTVSPYGLNAFFASANLQQEVHVRTILKSANDQYISYWGKDDPSREEPPICQREDDFNPRDFEESRSRFPAANDTGDELRVFRMAITVPGLLSEQQGWTTKAQALAAVVAFMGQVNTIYERDVSIRFILAEGMEQLIFLDDDTDPFAANGGGALTEESQILMQNLVGRENYDLGMVFVTGGCCAAGVSVVCGNRREINFSRFNNLQVTAHEIGHQFSCAHTWTSCGPSNNGQFGTNEYGSGTTIMSYVNICNVDNIVPPGDITYFGVYSQTQITNFVNSISCQQVYPSGNSIPSVTVPTSGFHIPIETPYELKGTATDADGDQMTFSWEQTNIRGIDFTAGVPILTAPTAADGNVPIQRLFNPVTTPNRTIPALENILSNTPTIYERLPTYTRNIKYTLYVRDNHPGSGGTTHEEVSFEVDETAGPFLVTAPNTCVTWMAGSTQTVTWDVANTTNANVNTQQVNILLSEDGGYTWPHTLAAATSNDGSESVTIPAGICSNMARIRVEAEGNIFFDLSNADFNIEDGGTPVVSPMAIKLDGGDDMVDFGTTVGNFGTGDFTVEAWVNTTSTGNKCIIGKRPSCGCGNFWNIRLNNGNAQVELSADGSCNNYVNFNGSATINDGAWHHIAFVRTGTFLQLFVDGVLDFSTTTGSIHDFNNTGSMAIGNCTCNANLEGYVDEIRIWTVARTLMELTDNNSCELAGTETDLLAYYPVTQQSCGTCAVSGVADATGNGYDGVLQFGASKELSSLDVEECPTCTNGNLTITAQPTNTSVADGAMASFSTTVTGNNISYQWMVSTDGGTTFSAIAGATSSTYSFTAGSADNNNQYQCLVVNGCDVQTTSAATLTVTCAGFSLSAITGEATPCQDNYYTYYVSPVADVVTWNWTAPVGWTITPYDNMIFAQAGSGSGNLSLTATDACGNMSTQMLAVTPVLVEITAHPLTQTVNEGDPVSLSTTVAAGGGTTAYQWQQSTDDGATFVDIGGATTNTFAIAAATVSHDGRQYRVLVENNCLQDTTNVGILTVNCVTSAPEASASLTGSTVVCGATTLTYACAPVAGADSYSWTLPAGWTGTSTTNVIMVTTNGSDGVVQVSAVNGCGTGTARSLEVVASSNNCERAVHFDGADDHMLVGQNGQYLSADMTVSFWVRPESINGLQQLIYNGHEFRVYLDDDHIRYMHSKDGGSYDDNVRMTFSTASLQTGTWYHITLTRNTNNREISFYLNGAFVETQQWETSFPSTPDDNDNNDMVFGAGPSGNTFLFKGSLDEIKIWTNIQSATEILEGLYCKPTGSETGLVAYYSFEQGQANGDNTGLTGMNNGTSNYPAATFQNFALTGTTSNVVEGTKDISIDGIGALCAGAGSITYSIDLPGTPTVTWTLPAGWTGTSTTESITVTPGANGGLITAEAALTCGTVTLEKAVTTTRSLSTPTNTRAIHLDDTDDYLEAPAGAVNLASSSFTLEFWAKRAVAGNDDFVLAQGSASGNNLLHVGFRSSNVFTFAFFGNDLNTTSTYSDTDWHHWACVYDKSIASPDNNRFIYRDGVLVGSDRTDDDFVGSGVFRVGNYRDDRYFGGVLDEVRVWDIARSQTEIQDNYYCTLDCPSGNVQLYLPMDDGIVEGNNTGLTEITDYSLYTQNAMIHNMALSGTTSNIVGKVDVPRYLDGDSDGYGDPATMTTDFCLTGNYITTPHDCDDSDAMVNPYAEEICGNSIDDNCDGNTDIVVNHGILLDGSDDRVSIPNIPHSEFFSVEAWIKIDNTDNDFRNLIKWQNGGDASLTVYTDGRIGYFEGAGNIAGPDLRDGQWHHIALLHDGYGTDNIKVYVDGTSTLTATRNGTINNTQLTIGGNADGGSNFDGNIDDVRFWDIVLTEEQIRERMDRRLDGNEANLIRYYTFDHGKPGQDNSGLTTAIDKTSNAAHGTLEGFALSGATSNWIISRSYPTFYADGDSDGFGGSTTWTCGSMTSFVQNSNDCDDGNAMINPYATEICGNSVDDDCDGNTDMEINKALHFDVAANNDVTIPVVDHGEFFTVEAWVKTPASSNFRDIIRWHGSPNARFIISNDNRLGYLQNNGGNWGGTNIGDDQWHHVALVHDGYSGNNIRVYVDGNSSASWSFPNPITATSVTIGGTSNMDGAIDDVRFWDAALTEAQIRSRMNIRLDGNEANLVRYYTFDHGMPGQDNAGLNTAIDKTTNAAHGTLVGFTLNGATSNWIAGRSYPTLYVDGDSDGFGGSTTWTCGTMTGYVQNSNDCDDGDAMINPYATEVCDNSVDDDCDGNTDMEVNKALYFENGARVLMEPNYDHDGDFTMEAWIKTSNSGGHIATMENGDFAVWYVSSAGLLAYGENDGTWSGWHGGPSIVDDQWHHVAIVRTATNVRTYIDGNSALNVGISKNIDNASFTIGANQNGGSAFLGEIDDFRLWDSALSQSDIQARMDRRLDGNETDLIRYFAFDHGMPAMDNAGIDEARGRTANNEVGSLVGFSLSGATSNWVAGRAYPTLYADADSDGYGDMTTTWTCGTMTGFLENNADCDDSESGINPLAEEVCGNGIDDNCDGNTDLIVNHGILVDGSNDRVNLPNLAHSEFFSVEAWIKIDNTDNDFRNLIKWQNGGDASLTVYTDGRIGYFEGAGNIGGPDLRDGQWHHIALLHDGYGSDNIRIYVDGIRRLTTTRNAVINNTELSIGGNSNGGSNFDGNVDDVRFWDIVLTEEQILERMNRRLDGTEANLVRYYTFDHGIAGGDNSTVTMAIDKTANAAHGTLNGFALTGATSNWVLAQPYPTLYLDGDSDGFGGSTQWTCGSMANYKGDNLDCDDSDNSLHPGATDVCANGVDENCNGVVDNNTLSLGFDGVDDEVTVNSTIGNFGTGDFTVEGRFRTTDSGTFLVSKRPVCGLDNFWNIKLDNGAIEMELYEDNAGSNGGSISGTTIVNDGNWHHFAVTRTNGIIRIFVDGDLEAQFARSTNLNNAATLTLGTNPCDQFSGLFEGEMDEIRIWSVARDIHQLRDFQNASLPGTVPGLEAYYDFDHPTATGGSDNTGLMTLADRTGNGNDGTLVSFMLSGTASNWLGNPGTTTTWYADTDMDGYGDPAVSTQNCSQPANFVADNTDCDDTMPSVNPGANEVAGNGVDDNCNGAIDEVSQVRWVFLNNGDDEGTCTSATDCCTNTFCYGLEYTPANTGTLAAYTTGFLVDCAGGSSVLTSNVSCVMTDNSTNIPDCTTGGKTFFNSSGNNGSLAVTVDVPVIIHQICLTIPNEQSVNIEEDVPTNITMSIDLMGGTTITEFPDYTTMMISGNTPPMVPADGTATVECIADATAPTTPTVMDDCGNTITPSLTSTVDDPNPLTCEGTRTYTYTYTSCSGLSSTWNFVYTIDHTTAPTEVGGPVATTATVECIASATAPTTLPVVQDVCGTVIAAPTPTVTDNPDPLTCEGTRTYSYVYTDCSGLSFTWNFVYTIDHTTAPAEVGGPVATTATVECIANATAPTTLPVVQDVCGTVIAAPTPTVTDNPYPLTCEGMRTYTYVYTDCSGLSFTWEFVYTIDHTTAPTEIGGPVDKDETVECIADATPPTTLPVVHDVCGAVIPAPAPTITDNPDPLTCEGTRVYSYVYTDCSGLSFTWDYTYTIDHITAPTEIGGPVATAATVECIANATAPTTLPVVQDVCGTVIAAPTPTVTDNPDPLTCEGMRTYTYVYTDCSGLTFTWNFVYTIDHTVAPAEVGGPVATTATVECLANATAPTTLPVVQDVCGTVIPAPTPTITDNPDPLTCEGTRTYSYVYTDCSGLSFTWNFVYTIDHTTAPAEVGGPVATTATVECLVNATAPTILPVVQDVCGTVIPAPAPTVTDNPDPLTCEGTRTYSYVYTDCSGLSFTWNFVYTIDHTTAPAEVGGPVATAATVECIASATAPTTLPVVQDVCGTVIPAPTPTITDAPDPLVCEGTRTYSYVYTDCSGLSFTWDFVYTIDHTTAPAEVGGPVATAATVECIANATAPTTLPVVQDVCGTVIPAPAPTVTDNPDPLTCEGTRTYAYVYTDCSGLSFTWNFVYTIDHTIAPAEVGGPVATTATVECIANATAPTTLPVVQDVCGTVIPAPTPTVTDNPDPLTCEGTRTYAYVYTDCSGLSFTWNFVYTIDHTTAPAEVGGPVATTATVECIANATAPTTLPVVQDVCGTVIAAPTPTVTDNPYPLTCEGMRTYTYVYTDCSGLSFTWEFVYTIDHTTAPTEIGGPVDKDETVECIADATPPTTLPVVHDVCGAVIPAPAPTITDNPDPLTCEGTRVYSYVYTDCSGLSFTWDYTYTIDHITAPTEIGGPVATAATVECIANATAPTTLPVVQDVCGTVIAAPTPTVTDNPDPLTCEGMRTYTYVYTDCSGLTFTWNFVYTIDHTVAPAEVGGPVATTATVECLANATAPTTLPVVQDVCGTVIPAPTPTITDNPDPLTCEGTRTYSYVYTDCSGLSFTWNFVYTIDHTTAPAEVGGPVATTATVECLVNATAPTILPVVQDVCGTVIPAPAPTVTDNPDPLTCEGTRTYSYVYTDCSGLSFTWNFVYTIDHTTAPAEVGGPVPTAATVECIASATAPTTLPVVQDVCGTVIPAPAPTVTDNPDPVTCEGTRTYSYVYTDCSGLSFTWNFVYTIDHTVAPAEVGGPVATAATVECIASATAPTTLPVVQDVCGTVIPAPTPTVTDNPDPLTCEGTRTYSYVYTDCSGLSFTWNFVYTIDHTTAPTEIGGPVATSVTVECIASATAPTTLPVVQDVCGTVIPAPTPTVTDNPDPLSCEGMRTYTYVYTDCSGLTFTWEFVYTIDHTTAPAEVGGPVATAATVECLAAATAPTTLPVVQDACGTVIPAPTPTVVDAPDPITCEGTRTYTYVYTDCSGLSFTWNFVYTIDLTTAPAEAGGPVTSSATIQVALDAVTPTTLPVFQDACGNVLTPTGPVVGGTYTDGDCRGTITYTYTYTDCASNTTDWVFTYNIDCGQLNLRVFLEGPYMGGNVMNTLLNDYHVLPGQDKLLSPITSIRIAAPFTPFGQPYNDEPWNFSGTDGSQYGEGTAPGAPANVMPYSPFVVDWILVSIRANGVDPSDEIFRCAGWLYSNGEISFPEACQSLSLTGGTNYNVVIEHRNHLGILATASLENDGGDYLELDFSLEDSYRPNVFRAGQKEVESGVWAMFCSNGEQENSIRSINSLDRTVWRVLQNMLGYSIGDHDMDASTNSEDETKWKNNQNKTTGVTFE